MTFNSWFALRGNVSSLPLSTLKHFKLSLSLSSTTLLAGAVVALEASGCPRRSRAMMRAVDSDDDGASTTSSLDDLPGPDEFLATAIKKLSLKVTPERASPIGGPRGSGSPVAVEDEVSRASSEDYDDDEREAIGEFLAASASPLRPTGHVLDDRPTASPKRALEEITTSLKLEHTVVEAVVEDIIDEAELLVAFPDAPATARTPVRLENALRESVADPEATETPRETAPTGPSRSAGAELGVSREPTLRELSVVGSQTDASWTSPASSSADEALRTARARLSDALRAVAASRVAPAGASAATFSEDARDRAAEDVAEAIACVWQACDAASVALASAMEQHDAVDQSPACASIAGNDSDSKSGLGRGGWKTVAARDVSGVRAAKRKMLEEAVFSAWTQSGDSNSNVMFSEEPLPTTRTWPLSPTRRVSPEDARVKRFAAAAAAAAGPSNEEGALSSPGRERARRWRAVVRRLALASLRRVQTDLGIGAASMDAGFVPTFSPRGLRDSNRTEVATPRAPGPPSPRSQRRSPYSSPNALEATDEILESTESTSMPFRRVAAFPSFPFRASRALARSDARSPSEWNDLDLIASFMTATRLLSASLDEWRARAAAAKERRRLVREQRRATALAERERSRVNFARSVFLGWRDARRESNRARAARYGTVSRAAIRRLTRSPPSRDGLERGVSLSLEDARDRTRDGFSNDADADARGGRSGRSGGGRGGGRAGGKKGNGFDSYPASSPRSRSEPKSSARAFGYDVRDDRFDDSPRTVPLPVRLFRTADRAFR
jgi:hypothetical protein